jgi:hypothetical protein
VPCRPTSHLLPVGDGHVVDRPSVRIDGAWAPRRLRAAALEAAGMSAAYLRSFGGYSVEALLTGKLL